MMDTATAAEAIAGTLHGRREWFRGVTTDSRAVAPGDLFVAIKGERFDGHDYVAQALERFREHQVAEGEVGFDLAVLILFVLGFPVVA